MTPLGNGIYCVTFWQINNLPQSKLTYIFQLSDVTKRKKIMQIHQIKLIWKYYTSINLQLLVLTPLANTAINNEFRTKKRSRLTLYEMSNSFSHESAKNRLLHWEGQDHCSNIILGYPDLYMKHMTHWNFFLFFNCFYKNTYVHGFYIKVVLTFGRWFSNHPKLGLFW